MDLLSQRYASPCFVLDGMISTGRLSEFVNEMLKIRKEEDEEKTQWEFYLHRVFEGSFAEFRERIENNQKHLNMSDRDFETAVNHSMDILNNFNPENGGEE